MIKINAMNVKPVKEKKKECNICGKMCISNGLGSHIRTHLKRKYHNCEECGKQFSSMNFLKRHKLKHGHQDDSEKEIDSTTNNKSRKVNEKECHICGKMFLLKGLNLHIRSHLNPNSNHDCKECGSKFSSKKQLILHKKTHYAEHICEICNKNFRNAHLLKHHTCINGKLKSYICEICGKGFIKPFYLKVHIRSHTKERIYKCDICDQRFMANDNLKKHYRKHLEQTLSDNIDSQNSKQNVVVSKNGVWSCDVCLKEFYNKYCLTRHMNIHSNETPFKCNICSRAFKIKDYLNHHYRAHKNIKRKKSDEKFMCDVCNVSFSFKHSLKRHKKLIHAQVNTVVCKYCDKSFRQNYHLQRHIREQHGKRNFKCEKCDKSFTLGYLLRFHEKVHKEPQHLCSICNKAFRYSSSLNQHLRWHTNTKPYICDICHEGFTSINSLERHYLHHAAQKISCTEDLNGEIINADITNIQEQSIRVASENSNLSSVEERIITCVICKLIFPNENLLQSHKDEFIKEGNFKCCICLQVYNNENNLFEHYNNHTASLLNGTVHISSSTDGIIPTSSNLSELENKNYECRICKKVFKNELSLVCHTDEFLQKNCFRCCKCQQMFYSKEILLEHYNTHNTSQNKIGYSNSSKSCKLEEKYMCKLCKKFFLDVITLEYHIGKFFEEVSLKCCICQQLFSDEKSLLKHGNMHNNLNNELLRTFMTKTEGHESLTEDLPNSKSTLGLDKKPHVCEICKKVFSNAENFEYHKKEISYAGNFKCCVCNQVFYDKNTLIEHYNIHSISDIDTAFTKSKLQFETEEKLIFCEVCKQNFQNKAKLGYHNNHFRKEGVCCVCHNFFSVKEHLLDHHNVHKVLVENVSSSSDEVLEVETKPYPCEVCKQIFLTKELLTCHVNEYSQENNYKCCRCLQNFSDNQILLEHHKVHEESKKNTYICFLNAVI